MKKRLNIMRKKSEISGFCKRRVYKYLAILITVIVLLSILFMYHRLNFKKVTECDFDFENRTMVYYTTFQADDLDNWPDELSEYDYDFDNHTYIITIGYKLKNISYSLLSRPARGGDYSVPKVVLSKSKDAKCYVYELPKVNIDYDTDDYERNVYFED